MTCRSIRLVVGPHCVHHFEWTLSCGLICLINHSLGNAASRVILTPFCRTWIRFQRRVIHPSLLAGPHLLLIVVYNCGSLLATLLRIAGWRGFLETLRLILNLKRVEGSHVWTQVLQSCLLLHVVQSCEIERLGLVAASESSKLGLQQIGIILGHHGELSLVQIVALWTGPRAHMSTPLFLTWQPIFVFDLANCSSASSRHTPPNVPSPSWLNALSCRLIGGGLWLLLLGLIY